MARNTDPSLRNQTIYSIYIRNYSPTGDFAGLSSDLDRIANLGVEILWLLPIHPIGIEKRKGRAGSPYAISDYRAINPEYGTLDDFSQFLDEAHSRGLKVIIDVVYNHTSPDSLLSEVHPEWYWKNPNGLFGNRIEDWSDIIDLDYSSPELWDYQIETLKGWLHEGVDGFRCDVASLLPLSFWVEARDACSVVNPDTIWLAETVDVDFINAVRRMGYNCLTDTETLRAFDISYDYDVFPEWLQLIDGDIELEAYINRLRTQESMLNDTDLKLRFIENHDQNRAASVLNSGTKLTQWTAFSLFAKGTGLIYAGQENAVEAKPDLFNKDPIDWPDENSKTDSSHLLFLKNLVEIKKSGIIRDGFYWYPEAPSGLLAAAYERKSPDGRLTGLSLGLFNIEDKAESEMNLKAIWKELGSEEVLQERISGRELSLSKGIVTATSEPMILEWGLTR